MTVSSNDDTAVVLDEGIVLCWNRDNPDAWNIDDYEAARQECLDGGYAVRTWSVGRRINIPLGTQCFMLTQGQEHPRGLIGVGVISGEPRTGPHYEDATRDTNYVEVQWTDLRPFDDVIPVAHIADGVPSVPWTRGIRGSGYPLKREEVDNLHFLWGEEPDPNEEKAPGELSPGEYWEGAVRTITVNRYERDPQARLECLQHHGYTCKACDSDLTQTYGTEFGRRAIHVHHIIPMSNRGGQEYVLDPVTDLIPLCPNCHNVIHKTVPVMTVDEFRSSVLGR